MLFLRSHRHIFQGFLSQGGANAPPWISQGGGHKFFKGGQCPPPLGGAVKYPACLNNSCWVWDLADVIFLKKDGKKDYSNAGSYRPISITSYIGKIFEQIIASRLEYFFKCIGLKDKHQEGFTKKRNTVRYLNRLDSDIREKLDKKYSYLPLY